MLFLRQKPGKFKMRTRFVKIFSTLIVGTALFIACGGGRTAPVIQASYKGALSAGDFVDVAFNSKAETLTATVTDGKYKNAQPFEFKTQWKPDLGQNVYTLQQDGQDVAGFLAIPDRLIISDKITMSDKSKHFFVGVPNVQDVSFDKLKNEVYNYVSLAANTGTVGYGTFRILDTENNKGSYTNGKDAEIFYLHDFKTQNKIGKNMYIIKLFITKKGKTFEVYQKNDSDNNFGKKLANFVPRVEADGKVFFVIDFAQNSGHEGVGFAITQAELKNSSFTDGNYDIATGSTGVSKGTLKGTTFTNSGGEVSLEINKPWAGIAEYSAIDASGSKKTLMIGFPVNSNEFYGIIPGDGFIATKAD